MTEMRVLGSGAGSHGGADLSLSGLLTAVAAAAPRRLAVVAGARRLTYADLDARATLVARHLLDAGIRPGEHVAILCFNRAEWLEAAFGAWRAGAVPVNVNYRYVAAELRYLLDDADAVALVAERSLAATVAGISRDLPLLRHVVLIDDDSPAEVDGVDYEDALAAAARSATPLPATGGDDLYLLYTGGTTGYPKGVMWRQEDIFRVALEQRRPGTPRAADAVAVAERAARATPLRMLVLGPLMHAAGQWNALSMLFRGATTVLNTDRVFSPTRIVELADRENAQIVQCVGDAMARPLAQELLRSPGRCAELTTVSSGGTPLTPTARRLWRSWRRDITVNDSYGGSETGVCGAASATGNGKTRYFSMGASVAVLDDRLRPLPPGSEQIGRIARTGRIPLGYYNDPVKTAQTFPVDADGRRWAISGDYGTVAADGSVELLGRGSTVINTGGEKVYPEEVEAVLKSHPGVADAIVVAAPDERLGQRVSAVVSLVPGRRPSDAELRSHCRVQLAGFKVPRTIRVVDEVRRTAVGKQDYRWASRVAREPQHALSG
ncbi:acyl-CoA synthetase [Thermobifida halotolerans]|uniref:Acyl-CoA synthetase n=1 Tax=Thermobifida halotolerans TaxID=483545 RepID=A0AA97LTW4_9ACTN|nr:acyl-CoA synthetase [Thermobifida halotolerans]UOE17973.1 acyl-CoA synthetase [Thermobifida halotolerans]